MTDTVDMVLAWRTQLVERLLSMAAVATLGIAVLATATARENGNWLGPAVAWAALPVIVGMILRRSAPTTLRAAIGIALLYGAGFWLLVQGAAVSEVFLLACPVMGILLIGVRTSAALLLLSTATLVGCGWWLQLPLGMIGGTVNVSFMRWLNTGSNFAFVGLLLTGSCAYLLKRLDLALSRERAVSASLRISQENLSQIAAQVPGMVFRLQVSRAGEPHFVYVSPGARTLFDLSPEQLLAEPRLLTDRIPLDDRRELMARLFAAGGAGRETCAEFRFCESDGRQRWVQARTTEVARDADIVLCNGVMVDITDRKASEALVWRQAHYDALTGLPNRLTLADELTHSLATANVAGQPMVLMLIDLDRFKEVNDAMGHTYGDQLLVQAGQRIAASVREGDTVARMGGDEFTVLMPVLRSAADAESIAERILQALAEVFVMGDERAYVTASIGLALRPEHAHNIDDLLKHADQALYVAKECGRNRLSWFTHTLQEQVQLRTRLAADLRQALALGQMHVVYQPIVDIKTGQVRKAEALLRWNHPERGPISPAVFIPIAESTGLIGPIGDWVFRTAAAQVKCWRERVDPAFQISVNRSPVQFRAATSPPTPWAEVLDEMGLASDAIAVEITEGLLLDNGSDVSGQLAALRASGMTISLDDFGTGYSALAYLQRFEIDTLKIDRSFVSGMAAGPTGQSLCRAMVLMAHELAMDVIAEGVETAEQRDWLREAGCDLAQGWFYGKPMRAHDFEAWLDRRAEEASPVLESATSARTAGTTAPTAEARFNLA